MNTVQTVLTVGLPTLAVLIGILVNNSRLNDMNGRFGDTNGRIGELRAHFDQRLDDLRDMLRAEMQRVEGVMDARLTRIEQELKLR